MTIIYLFENFFVRSGVPLLFDISRYFARTILQFQFAERLCKVSGHTGPLHRCDFSGSKQAGEELVKKQCIKQLFIPPTLIHPNTTFRLALNFQAQIFGHLNYFKIQIFIIYFLILLKNFKYFNNDANKILSNT